MNKVKVFFFTSALIQYNPHWVKQCSLHDSHVHVTDIEGNPTIREAIEVMEEWAQLDIAREVIERKKLNHSTVTAGDVIYREGAFHLINLRGVSLLERERPIPMDRWQALLQAANDFRYLATVASEGMTPPEAIRHMRRSNKSALDDWLMDMFCLTEIEAREVSNMSGEIAEFNCNGDVRWIAARPAPTWEQYPNLTHWLKRG